MEIFLLHREFSQLHLDGWQNVPSGLVTVRASSYRYYSILVVCRRLGLLKKSSKTKQKSYLFNMFPKLSSFNCNNINTILRSLLCMVKFRITNQAYEYFVFSSIHTVNYAYSTYLNIQNCYAMFDIC